MTMEKSVSEIQKILVEWDPLGDQKSRIPDLNNYETEAMDIDNTIYIFGSDKKSVINIVIQTINQAFNLNVSREDALDVGTKIWNVYHKYHKD